ncbi:MAG: nucleoside hydrolase [Chitinophagales bacterium]|nr:nucleoside hydrolase [Chitinophagales bacterium]
MLVLAFLFADRGMAQQKPVSVIFDADMGPMIDDVAAIATLFALESKGEAKVLATIGSNNYPGAGQVFDVFNTFFGYPNMPIGLPKSGAYVDIKDASKLDILGGWTNRLIRKFPTDLTSNELVPEAVSVYRSILSKQPDHSVTIVTVGFLTNLSNLLASGPDQNSKLTGMELVKLKVKRLVSMAGTFTGPVTDPQGENKEYNLWMDAKASKHVFEDWPTEVIFDGFALGNKVKIGQPIVVNDTIKNNPVKYVFHTKVGKYGVGFSGYDAIAVLVAVRGAAPYLDMVPGHITVEWDGSNGWTTNKNGQFYLKERFGSIEKLVQDINKLMQIEK